MPAPVLRERYMTPTDDHSAFVWVESYLHRELCGASLLGERDDRNAPPNDGYAPNGIVLASEPGALSSGSRRSSRRLPRTVVDTL